MKIAAISGSLRAGSSNTAVLRAAARLAPAGVEVVLFEGIADLPFFNPDLDGDDVPAPVGAMRALIGNVDGLLISSPEYARGVAGVLKNALDWLVASETFAGKPTALINTSPRAFHAQASLREILSTMAARLIPEAFVSISLTGKAVTPDDVLADTVCTRRLSESLEALIAAIRG